MHEPAPQCMPSRTAVWAICHCYVTLVAVLHGMHSDAIWYPQHRYGTSAAKPPPLRRDVKSIRLAGKVNKTKI